MLTKPKSNTTAPSVETGSRTRTKRNAIKTRFTSDDILGPARPFLDTIVHFTTRLTGLEKPTLVATAVTSFHGQDEVPEQMAPDLLRNRTGTNGFDICKRRTSSGSATRPRSSIGRIISDNISSTATLARAANGQTCWRMLVCWRRIHPGEGIQ